VQRIGAWFARVTERFLPDPMVIACVLTLVTAAAAILFPCEPGLREAGFGGRVIDVVRMWFGGLWNAGFLVFALQMCLVLLTGYGLAKAPAATRVLERLASGVGSQRSAVVLVATVSCIGCWINWGFGLIASGLLVTRVRAAMARRGAGCNAALLVAAAYAGMMIWHGGLSGSAPLRVAKEGVAIVDAGGEGAPHRIEPISIAHTTFGTANLVLTVVLLCGVPLVLRSMASELHDPVRSSDGRKPGAPRRLKPAAQVHCSIAHGDLGEPGESPAAVDSPAAVESPAEPATPSSSASAADRMNRSRIVPVVIALGLFVALVDQVAMSGAAAVGLNFVNATFLATGLLLHRNLLEYVRAVAEGGRAITGIVLQFPLYSGIQAIMFGAGLAAALSGWFVEAATWSAGAFGVDASHTFPVATFFSAGLVNLFVPSGGGQWIVQGPIMCSAAQSLHVPIETTIMAVAYGDQWTNMIQPFWAIPLMGLTAVDVRRFMGYCALLMVVATVGFLAALALS